MRKKTLVLGASTNPSRYAYRAILLLQELGYPVVAIGKEKTTIGNIEVNDQPIPFSDIHTVTIYLNPKKQSIYYDYILSLKPKRIIFNPGTENPELRQKAQKAGIEVVEYCTIIMLNNRLF